MKVFNANFLTPMFSDLWYLQFALKMQLIRFLIGGFDIVWKETHAYNLMAYI